MLVLLSSTSIFIITALPSLQNACIPPFPLPGCTSLSPYLILNISAEWFLLLLFPLILHVFFLSYTHTVPWVTPFFPLYFQLYKYLFYLPSNSHISLVHVSLYPVRHNSLILQKPFTPLWGVIHSYILISNKSFLFILHIMSSPCILEDNLVSKIGVCLKHLCVTIFSEWL